MSKFFFISKKDAFHICDKSQYKESTIWEKFKLMIRCLFCDATRHYVNRNTKLTEAIKTSKLDCLSHHERQLLNERLKKKLKDEV
ncbi:hypothetical protein BXY82_3089 [Gelidibacter sediminis]|uniref:Glycine dehydrogenase n=1 Tax=Gelidibacter sediminis TaxID=1608710 RepID=A0A4R7PJ31_9FLAO|nr:hypothetical protein [Gelidibacter sediminis]TDU33791.1 hypothetical protein BXY82_3089 [Gelidibacter sediminis]